MKTCYWLGCVLRCELTGFEITNYLFSLCVVSIILEVITDERGHSASGFMHSTIILLGG